jgi:hypothetical protein
MVRVITPQGRRSSVRPFWQGESPGGRVYTTARVGAWTNDLPVDDGVWLYAGTAEVGFSLGAFLVAPREVDHDLAVLLRTTRIGVPSGEAGYEMESTRLAMDALSPEGHLLGAVQGAGPRECWRSLVPAIDPYFNTVS